VNKEDPDTMDPATPDYYALSTIAQCAAALAALIGFFGLWRLERLQDRINTTNRSIDALDRDRTKLISSPLRADSRSHTYGEQLSRFDRHLRDSIPRYGRCGRSSW
jgi:hypothetical protein